MLYLSFPTETGTLYSAEELRSLADICRKYGLLMYVDGARLAYGLAVSESVTMKTLVETADRGLREFFLVAERYSSIVGFAALG